MPVALLISVMFLKGFEMLQSVLPEHFHYGLETLGSESLAVPNVPVVESFILNLSRRPDYAQATAIESGTYLAVETT
jgi:hypothetical protein